MELDGFDDEERPPSSRRRLFGQVALGSLGWVLVMMVVVSVGVLLLVGLGWFLVQVYFENLLPSSDS